MKKIKIRKYGYLWLVMLPDNMHFAYLDFEDALGMANWYINNKMKSRA